MFKYHCLNPISKVGTDKFSNNYVKTDNIQEADGILVRSAAMHDMDLPKGLLAVARAGAGVNNIPLDKCASQGIVVFNTPGANANAVKELVIAGLFLASRKIVKGIEWAKTLKGNGAEVGKMVDYNKPFSKDDNLFDLTSNLGNLYRQSIDQTLSLIDFKEGHANA